MPVPDRSFEVDPPLTAEQIQGSPESLKRDSKQREAFPVSSLGPILSDVVYLLHSVIQAPVEICAHSVMAAVSLAVQAHANISIHGRTFPPSLFFFSIAKTGERKSAVDNECLRPHIQWEYNARAEWYKNKQGYRNDKELWENERKQIINGKMSDMEREEKLAYLGVEPVPEKEPILLVDEPTYEGLVKMFKTSIPTVGLFSNEGGRFLGSYSMGKDNMLKSMAGLSQLWDGARITRVRAGDESLILYGRRLSLHLMVQPRIVQDILSSEIAHDQGFLSRIMMVSPEPMSGHRVYDKRNLNNEAVIVKYREKMTNILSSELPYEDPLGGDLNPRELQLDHNAEGMYESYHNEVESYLGPEGRYDSVRGFANKAPEHATRIAGCLALFDNLHTLSIKAEHMQKGITLVEYYLREHIRLFEEGGKDIMLENAMILLKWLRDRQIKQFYPEMVYKNGPHAFRKKSDVMPAIAILDEHGYLLQLDRGVVIDGKARRTSWQLV